MKKSKFILIIVLLLIVENVAMWFTANFYYQYKAYQIRADSKLGQTEVCKTISISSDLFSVLEKMDKYYPDLVHVDSVGQINLLYGSEAKGFVTVAGVGFIFDKNYKLTHKNCDASWEPETPTF